tara:strand:- start:1533 stop:2237 length:705 start_codon:yes stop_codon:yes gene_type:complete
MEPGPQPFDLMRIFFGEEGSWFYLEILFRTLFVYVYALLLLRWLGSRTVGQLSTVEFLLVIALGSAVGDPMFQPDVPLLHAMVVITIVVLVNRGLDVLIARFKRVERLVDGIPRQLVRHGVLCDASSGQGELGSSETFQKLRQAGVRQLGEVEAAFVEPNGAISIFRQQPAPPGLPIMPPWEITKPGGIQADESVKHDACLACLSCGTTQDVRAGGLPGPCANCSNEHWTPAVD